MLISAIVHALYNRSRYVTFGIASMFAIEVIGMAASLAKGVGKIKFDDNCVVTSWPIAFIAYGYACLAVVG
jgi:hypothetical protein